jgi:hypothetical protein
MEKPASLKVDFRISVRSKEVTAVASNVLRIVSITFPKKSVNLVSLELARWAKCVKMIQDTVVNSLPPRRNKTEQDRTRPNKTEQDRTRPNKTEQDRTRPNKTEQEVTRSSSTTDNNKNDVPTIKNSKPSTISMTVALQKSGRLV